MGWYSVETQNGYLQNSQASCYSVNLPGQNMVEPWRNMSQFKIFSHSKFIFVIQPKRHKSNTHFLFI